MSAITTHVLDTSRGCPAAGVRVELHRKIGSEWKQIGEGRTDANGRCQSLSEDTKLETGTYRLLFHASAYYEALHTETFYAEIPVIFEVREAGARHHVPLLLNPYGYSTYRGS